jgi:hypothetical protein
MYWLRKPFSAPETDTDMYSTGPGSGDGTPVVEPKVNPPSAGPTAEEIANLLSAQIGPSQDRVASAIEQQAAAAAALDRTQRELLAKPISELTPAELKQRYEDEFVADPRGKIDSQIDEKLKLARQQQQAEVNQLRLVANQVMMQQHEEAVDTKFGSGTFGEVFKPLLEARMRQAAEQRPELLGSPEFIDQEVSAIRGMLFDDLTERQKTHIEARQTEENERLAKLVNGIRPNGNLSGGTSGGFENTQEPSEEEKAYWRSQQKGGSAPTDLAKLRAARDDKYGTIHAFMHRKLSKDKA